MSTRPLLRLVVLAAFGVGGGLAAHAIAHAAILPASGADPTCVMMLPDSGGMLVNQCGSCREVTLERVRPAESIPSIRAMMLPGEATTPIPFRGPGRTRIIGERACPPPPGSIAQQAALEQ